MSYLRHIQSNVKKINLKSRYLTPRSTSTIAKSLVVEDLKFKKRYLENLPCLTSYGGKYVATMLPGIGSGPQMMEYVREVFKAACVPVDFEIINDQNISDHILTAIGRNNVAIKGHIVDLNLILRAVLDLYVYKVHCLSYPNIKSRMQGIDIYVFRQNVEGEYTMLEHAPRNDIVKSLKIITRKTTEKFAEYAYKFALKNKRKKITVVHKANIMKLTDGLFLETILRIGKSYPKIETDSIIIDNCCMQLVQNPGQFDVILTPNLYGNIIISIICGLIGGHGLISGQNIGDKCGIFEVGLRHLAFEDKRFVNPVAMLNASVNMLNYIHLHQYAELISDSIYKTLVNDRIHTPDIGGEATGEEFVENVIYRVKEKVHLKKIDNGIC